MDSTHEGAMKALERLNYTTERLMFEVMRPCTDIIARCSWQGVIYPCKNIFLVATSTEGFCCSFNYKPDLDPNVM